MTDCSQKCGNPKCKHPRTHHTRNSCSHDNCDCKKTYNEIGQDERAKREGGRFDRG